MQKQSVELKRLLSNLNQEVQESRRMPRVCYQMMGCIVHLLATKEEDLNFVHDAIAHLVIDHTPEVTAGDLSVHVGRLNHELQSLVAGLCDQSTSRSHQYVYTHKDVTLCIQRSVDIELVQCYWSDTGVALYLCGTALTTEILTAPFRTIFGWHGLHQKGIVLHAAALADAQGAFLYGGKSGSGKSIFSLYGVEAGMNFYGDDSVYCETETLPVVHSLYRSVRVHESDKKRFALNYVKPISAQDRKWYAYLPQEISRRSFSAAPIEAMLLLADQNQTANLRAASAFEALQVLAPSSLLHIPVYGSGLQLIKRLLERVPVYRIRQPAKSTDICRYIEEIRHLQAGAS